MTTDNSLPDVLWVAREYSNGQPSRPYFYTTAAEPPYRAVRYTPAAPAEATIKSLRDALRRVAIDNEAEGSHCWLCTSSWAGTGYPEHHDPDCLLAKDAP